MDPILIGMLIIGALVIVGGLVYMGLRDDMDRDPMAERLSQYGDNALPESLEELEMSLSFRDRVLLPVMTWFANIMTKFTPQSQIESTRRKLEQAAMNTEPSTFFGLRIIAGIIFFVLGIFLFFMLEVLGEDTLQNGLALAAFTYLGFYFPVMSVNSRIRKRQTNIQKALPDALDLLVICVEAGLGFDMAMGKVYDKWDNELATAFGRVLREIQLGKPRREALKNMSDRMDVPDVNAFVAAIIQADQLGVSMSKILRVQSDQMRIKRRQRAQEKAQQAPVKMLIPMVLLIFPSIWIVLLGPSVLKVMGSGLDF